MAMQVKVMEIRGMQVKMMSRAVLVSLAAAYAGLSYGAAPTLNAQSLQPAVEKYLQDKGDFCLGKFDWPISVSDADAQIGTNNARQMPVLEKLGLVTSAAVPADGGGGRGKIYALTAEGEKYYRVKRTVTLGPADKPVEHAGDFCAAKLSLDKVVSWEKPTLVDGHPQTNVNYTYKADPAPWTQDPEIKNVFPMVRRIVEGAGTLRLVQLFSWSNNQWVAVTPGS